MIGPLETYSHSTSVPITYILRSNYNFITTTTERYLPRFRLFSVFSAPPSKKFVSSSTSNVHFSRSFCKSSLTVCGLTNISTPNFFNSKIKMQQSQIQQIGTVVPIKFQCTIQFFTRHQLQRNSLNYFIRLTDKQCPFNNYIMYMYIDCINIGITICR